MQFFVQIGLKMEPGDCPPLNINAMRAVSVKSVLKYKGAIIFYQRECECLWRGANIFLGGQNWEPFDCSGKMNRLAVYSYLTRYTHQGLAD